MRRTNTNDNEVIAVCGVMLSNHIDHKPGAVGIDLADELNALQASVERNVQTTFYNVNE